MKVVKIIPCLDTKDGKVVKGINFTGLKEIGDPVEMAKKYNSECADELVLLDTTASIENHELRFQMVKSVKSVINIPLSVGGGIDSIDDATKMFEAGADKISIGTAAVKNSSFMKELVQKFGGDKIIAAIDTKNVNGKDKVVIYGGNEVTDLDLIPWAKEVEKIGVRTILLTSWNKDGTKEGFDNKSLRDVAEAVSIPVVASGGAGKIKDFISAVKDGKASYLLAASVFHYDEIKIKDLKSALAKEGIAVSN